MIKSTRHEYAIMPYVLHKTHLKPIVWFMLPKTHHAECVI